MKKLKRLKESPQLWRERDTLGVVELDNTPLTPTQQQQVCPSNSVVRLLEWNSRRIGENMGHMYELIFPQVKRLLDLSVLSIITSLHELKRSVIN